MAKKPTKEYVLSLRLPKNLIEEIENAAKREDMGKSDYIRKAISDAITFSNVGRKNQTFLLNPATIKFSLQFMEDLDIEEYANISLQNARKILKDYLNEQIGSSIVQKYLSDKKTIISGVMTYLMQSIFGPTAQKWFERIHAAWNGDIITITGIHRLGLPFSKFIRFYFLHLFQIFDFIEVSTNIIMKEERVKLEFRGENGKFDVLKLM